MPTVTLSDGRRLGYAEWGDPEGEVLLSFHGTPGSRFDRPPPEVDATGLRVLTVERPGMGLSDPLPGRTLLQWPDDVRQLTDTLGFERFLLVGASGGGPAAAAVAWAMPERVRALALVSTTAPPEHHDTLAGMHDMNRTLFQAIKADPKQAEPVVQIIQASMEMGVEALVEAEGIGMPDVDRLAIREMPGLAQAINESGKGAFEQGTTGVLHDFWLFTQPWGFDPGEIRVPTVVAHGAVDGNVSPDNGRWLADHIPGARLLWYDEEGHISIVRRMPEVWAALRELAGS